MSENKKVEAQVQDKAREFAQAYEELCKKHGYQIVVVPAYKARDDGTWSLVMQASVGKLPEETQEPEVVK